MEIIFRHAFPGSMEELSAPQKSLAPGLHIELVWADQLLTELLVVGLDLQGVFGHQETQRHGGGRGNSVDKFGFHFVFFKKRNET